MMKRVFRKKKRAKKALSWMICLPELLRRNLDTSMRPMKRIRCADYVIIEDVYVDGNKEKESLLL